MYPVPAPVHDPTAVMGRRFGAYLIDALIGGILVMILMFSFATRESYGSTSTARAVCDDINDNSNSEYFCAPVDKDVFVWKGDDVLLSVLVGLGFWFLNDAVLTGLTGFSIGKGVVGLRVVRSDGRLCGFSRSTLRWLLWAADGAPWCFPLVGLIVAPASKGHRRVGDHVAKTFVVDKHSVGRPVQVPGIDAPYAVLPPQWGTPPPQPQWGPPQPQWGPPQPQWGPPTQQPPQPPQPPQPWGPPPQASPWGSPTMPPPGSSSPWAPPGPAPAPSVPPAEPPPGGAGPMWAPPPAPGTPTPPAGDPTLVQPIAGPPTEPVAAVTSPGPAGSTPGVGAPLWDDARDTYIQWDPDIERWVQWDERARRWDPI